MRKNVFTHQDLIRFLTTMEETISQKEMLRKLLEQQTLDPENFRVGFSKIPGEKLDIPVVIGGHCLYRGRQRFGLNAERLLDMATYSLKNPFVGAEVMSHPVIRNNNQIVPFNEDRVDSTVAIFEGKRYALVFQSGFSFILVKTIWDTSCGELFHNRGNIVLHIGQNHSVKLM